MGNQNPQINEGQIAADNKMAKRKTQRSTKH